MKYRNRNIMLIGLTALLAAGCQSELLVDFQEQQQAAVGTIDFVGGFIDNQVNTKAVTKLYQHSASMGVWAWQAQSNAEETPLFNNQEVVYSSELEDWTYSPKRYWSANSSYRFYAYAPHSSSVEGASVTIDSESGRFSIEGISLEGSNLMSDEASRSTIGLFGSVADVDWMIDRNGLSGTRGNFGSRVTFNMQHILAKFNVKVRVSDVLANDTRTTVTLDSITISSLAGGGSFEQKLNHTPDPDNVQDNAVQEWTLDNTASTYDLLSTRFVDVDGTGYYVIESLVLPQTIGEESKVKACFTMTSADGREERFVSTFGLSEAFGSFATGHNYTLTVIMAPDAITFDAGSGSWDDHTVVTDGTVN